MRRRLAIAGAVIALIALIAATATAQRRSADPLAGRPDAASPGGTRASSGPATRTSATPTPTASTAPSPSYVVATNTKPPPAGGYFTAVRPRGNPQALPSDATCAKAVHRSKWEPRPVNTKRNQTLVDPAALHRSFAARPYDPSYDTKWNTWLLPRVDGQMAGTTDEIFQWAACKWGIPDNVLLAMAVRESTWYQYLTYPDGRPVTNYGSGDYIRTATSATAIYCDGIDRFGYRYQRIYGDGKCPETFSILGIKSWQAPARGVMTGNQNGAFPFARTSTALAADYVGSYLRGCTRDGSTG